MTNRISLLALYGSVRISNERVKIFIFKEGDYVRFNLCVGNIDRIGILDDVDIHSTNKQLLIAVIKWLNDNREEYNVIQDRDTLLKYLYENVSIWD